MESDDRVVRMERLVFFGEFLESSQKIADGHVFIVNLWPGDHPLERTAFDKPLMSDVNEWLVIRHKSAAELRSSLEVLRIRSIFRERIDASNKVPACLSKSFHKISVDVVVRVEKEATSHTSLA